MQPSMASGPDRQRSGPDCCRVSLAGKAAIRRHQSVTLQTLPVARADYFSCREMMPLPTASAAHRSLTLNSLTLTSMLAWQCSLPQRRRGLVVLLVRVAWLIIGLGMERPAAFWLTQRSRLTLILRRK